MASYSIFDDTREFVLNKNPFAYNVVLEGDLEYNEDSDYDEERDFGPLVVKTITFEGFGDATEIDFLQGLS